MPDVFATALGGPGFPAAPPVGCGFKTHVVQSATGVTYRQLDYWARTGLVTPSIVDSEGSGNARLYSFSDIVTVRVIKRLLDSGVSLRNVRVAAEYLRATTTADLGSVTLICDGTSVFDCTDDEQIVDLLSGGQGVFGIAVGRTVTEVADAVRFLPRIDPVGAVDVTTGADQLAAQRAARRTA